MSPPPALGGTFETPRFDVAQRQEAAMSLYAAIDLRSSNSVSAVMDGAGKSLLQCRRPNDWVSPVLGRLALYRISVYGTSMMKTFADKDTEALFNGVRIRRFVNFEGPARRKLEYLDAAVALEDLRVPPGNRLELLKGDRAGQHCIRVNDQFRVCFRWKDSDACDVEICDYH
ncbi:Plasmid maintenance system killer [mine drainage metagenome]|uniref:Plasmid maintenance system killer n=2 Tax=mine drainage metagenome TaxID=410659 RepID=T0ZSM9_9ZZZZ